MSAGHPTAAEKRTSWEVRDGPFATSPGAGIAIKYFCRIATRYDKLARSYLASVCLAAALVWWI
jgi:transposase